MSVFICSFSEFISKLLHDEILGSRFRPKGPYWTLSQRRSYCQRNSRANRERWRVRTTGWLWSLGRKDGHVQGDKALRYCFGVFNHQYLKVLSNFAWSTLCYKSSMVSHIFIFYIQLQNCGHLEKKTDAFLDYYFSNLLVMISVQSFPQQNFINSACHLVNSATHRNNTDEILQLD